jgi:hypothetical protein
VGAKASFGEWLTWVESQYLRQSLVHENKLSGKTGVVVKGDKHRAGDCSTPD